MASCARAIVLFWCLFCGSSAQGQAGTPPELSFTWHAAAGCPDQHWAERTLNDRAGRALRFGAGAGLVVYTELKAAVPSGYQLRLVTEQNGQRGERILSGRQCASLADTAILVVALALSHAEGLTERDEPAAATGAAPTGDSDGGSVPEPKLEPNADAVAEAPARANAHAPFGIRVGAVLDVGLLPAVGLGPEATLSFTTGWFRAELSGLWLPGRDSEHSEAGQVSVSMWALRPAGCARLLRAAISLDLCVGMELGRASGQGSGLAIDRERHWLHRAAWTSLHFSTPLGEKWSLGVAPGLTVPLGRPSFVSLRAPAEGALEERTELHTPAPVAARLSLGIERAF